MQQFSWEDIGNGYTLDYNSNGILWRVNAAGIPHPDDLENFYEQQEIIQGYSDNLAAELKSNINLDKVRIDDAADISEGSSNAAEEIGAVAENIAKESSKAGATSPDSFETVVIVTGKRIYSWKLFGFEVSTEDIHQFLDWIGLVPGVSIFASGADTIIYFAEGEYSEALIAAVQMIPGAKLLKAGTKFKVVLSGIKGSSKAVKVSGEKIIESANAANKGGETIIGHALQKHAGRNPEIWGKIKGGPEEINQTALKHLNEIMEAPGDFVKVTNERGIQFLEKKLPDGRGVRLNLDGTFKGFLDQ